MKNILLQQRQERDYLASIMCLKPLFGLQNEDISKNFPHMLAYVGFFS